MRTQQQSVQPLPVAAEPWMNGAALVMEDGHEIPITDAMVRKALDLLEEEEDWKARERFRLSC